MCCVCVDTKPKRNEREGEVHFRLLKEGTTAKQHKDG